MQAATEFAALSWNYFSIGMDAKTVYGFDRLRSKKPNLAPGGAINKVRVPVYAEQMAVLGFSRDLAAHHHMSSTC